MARSKTLQNTGSRAITSWVCFRLSFPLKIEMTTLVFYATWILSCMKIEL